MVRIVSIIGVDGSGKTTQALLLHYYLRRMGINAEYLWGRWFAFTTYFLYVYARILRRTIVIKQRKYDIRVHAWWIDPLLRKLYPYTMILDLALWFALNVLKAKLKRVKILILDRFILDNLLDIVWEIRSISFLRGLLGKLMYKLVDNTHLVILSTSTNNILERKRDIISMREIEFKRKCYEIIAMHFNAPLVDTSQSTISQTFKELLKIIRLEFYSHYHG